MGKERLVLVGNGMAGMKVIEELLTIAPDRYGITLHIGREVIEIDRWHRRVIAADGTSAPYDRLLLATGSDPFIIPVPGKDLPGVLSYRDIHDVEAMLAASRSYKEAVVIGGGLLGLEAAYGLMQQGMAVTVVHLEDTLMERQLDRPAGDLLKQSLEARGMRFLLNTQTAGIVGEERVQAVRFANGSGVSADLVVMAVGIRPNTALAQRAGLYCERGVVV